MFLLAPVMISMH